jgi:hypothetical protein
MPGRAPARRSLQEDRIMVRSSVRRAAALTAAAALAVLAGAGPALAAGGGNTSRAVVGAQAGTDGLQSDAPCPHHHGLVSGLLEGVVHIVDGLL